jgi:hypothetical protein
LYAFELKANEFGADSLPSIDDSGVASLEEPSNSLESESEEEDEQSAVEDTSDSPPDLRNSTATKPEKEVERTWSNHFIIQQYRTIGKQAKDILKDARKVPLTEEKCQEGLDKIDLLLAKYKKSLTPPKKEKELRMKYPVTVNEVLKRLKGSEEAVRPWSVDPDMKLPNGGLFYRTWDMSSQCKILKVDFGLLSGGPNSHFETAEGRKKDLQCHANWGNRVKTPFVSVTPSARDIQNTWVYGFRRRQKEPITTIRLTIMNGHARVAKKNPLIRMLAEIIHYKVEIPKKCSMGTYQNEWLFPFRVFQDEIIWTFHWTDVLKWMERNGTDKIDVWEAMVARPALEEHEGLRKSGESLEAREAKLINLMLKLMPDAVKTYWRAAQQACLVGWLSG